MGRKRARKESHSRLAERLARISSLPADDHGKATTALAREQAEQVLNQLDERFDTSDVRLFGTESGGIRLQRRLRSLVKTVEIDGRGGYEAGMFSIENGYLPWTAHTARDASNFLMDLSRI